MRNKLARFTDSVWQRSYRHVQSTTGRISSRVRGVMDHRSLLLRFPTLEHYEARAALVRRGLVVPYEVYVNSISTRLMAVSLETATLLRVLCEVLRPKRVLDLGSGFSSFVLRNYAAQRGDVTVMSVDDDPLWLNQTRRFLLQNQLPIDDLLDYDSFKKTDHGPFDLIFHDLGNMATRAETLLHVLEMASVEPSSRSTLSNHLQPALDPEVSATDGQAPPPATAHANGPPKGTVVVLDDVHKRAYHARVKAMLWWWDCKYFDLRTDTGDAFSRHAAVLCDVQPRHERTAVETLRHTTSQFATALAPLPGVGKAVIELSQHLHRYDPIDLDCGLQIVPDRLNPAWQSILKNRCREKTLDTFLASYLRPGDGVIDAGAGIGVQATIAAKTVATTGRVYSFEADPRCVRQLRKTVKRNRLINVSIEPVLLNDDPGQVKSATSSKAWGTFMLNPQGQTNNNDVLDVNTHHTRQTRRTYRATSIDQYVKDEVVDRLDLIKIDVELPVMAVLRGAENTIRRFQPALMVETSIVSTDRGCNFEQIFDFLRWQGYWVYASMRSRTDVIQITDATQAMTDRTHQNQALDLFCRLPGREDDRWAGLWFTQEQDRLTTSNAETDNTTRTSKAA